MYTGLGATHTWGAWGPTQQANKIAARNDRTCVHAWVTLGAALWLPGFLVVVPQTNSTKCIPCIPGPQLQICCSYDCLRPCALRNYFFYCSLFDMVFILPCTSSRCRASQRCDTLGVHTNCADSCANSVTWALWRAPCSRILIYYVNRYNAHILTSISVVGRDAARECAQVPVVHRHGCWCRLQPSSALGLFLTTSST